MTLDIMDGELWQWDTGREVEAAGCEQVHFAKSTAGTCYTVEVAGDKAKIPDELLQAAGRVYAWAYITDEAYGGRTRIEALWDVKRRAKPAEYVYEPSDQRTIKDAETARDEAKAAQEAAEAARDRAVAAEVKGARATTLAPGSDATAAMEGNVLVVGVPKGDALRYSDLTADQIAELKKPATDAAAEIGKTNEEYKAMLTEQAKAFGDAQRARAESYTDAERARDKAYTKAETDRDAAYNEAEGKRQAAEGVRSENEGGRKTAETGRDTAEKARVEAEAKRERGWTDLKAEAEKSMGDAVERADAANKAATKAIADVKATEAKLYPVAENVLKGTAKDTFIHVDDAFPSSLLGIEIEGATEQVTTAGKNLLDYFKLSKLSSSIYVIENENLKVLAIDGRAWSTVPTLMTLKAGTYCASGAYFEIRNASDNSDIFIGKGKFTLNKDTEVKVKVGTNLSSYPGVVKAQIEMGNMATAYEPYTGGKPSPSPDFPQEIKVVENPTIKILGRNLMSVGVDELGNSANNFYMSPQIDRLTLSFYAENDWWTGNPSGPRIFIHEYYPSNGTYSAQAVGVLEFSKEIGKRVKATIPFKSKLTDKYEGYICSRGYFDGVYKNCHDFMISFGDANETYSDYVSAESALILPSEHPYLAKLPDGKADEIRVDKDGNVELVARVARVLPSEQKIVFVPGDEHSASYISFNFVNDSASKLSVMSNAYETIIWTAKSGYIYCPQVSNVMIRDNRFTSEEQAKKLLDGVVVYIAVEPMRYPLGKIEMPKAQDSIVNVWTDAEITPKTGIEYTRDVNIVVANLEAAIASITEG